MAASLLLRDAVVLNIRVNMDRRGFLGSIAYPAVGAAMLAPMLLPRLALRPTRDRPALRAARQGRRAVSPSVYTMPEELDRFCDALAPVIKNGIPA